MFFVENVKPICDDPFNLAQSIRLFDAVSKVWVLNSDGLDLSLSLGFATLTGVVCGLRQGKEGYSAAIS